MSDLQLNRPCSYCGVPLFLDAGEPQTREHPGSPPRAYCFDCGVDFEPTEDDYRLLWGEGAEAGDPAVPEPPALPTGEGADEGTRQPRKRGI